MTLLSREAILAVNDRKFDTVEVPEWGGAVRLASMTGGERLDYEALAAKEAAGETVDLLAHMLAATAVDASGAKLFRVEDVGALNAKNPAILLRLFKAAARINALTSDAIEALEKN